MKKKITRAVFMMGALAFLAIGVSGAYLSDTEQTTGNQFSAGTWTTTTTTTVLKNIVINEIYSNVGTRTTGHGQSEKTEDGDVNEWVELYNPNNVEVNIKNYSVSTSGQDFQLNANYAIPAKGFVLLSHDGDTWRFWDEQEIKTLNLGGSPEEWLADDGDSIYLKNSTGTIIDEVVFSKSDSGQSWERKLPGFDTNNFSDFVLKSMPTPGE